MVLTRAGKVLYLKNVPKIYAAATISAFIASYIAVWGLNDTRIATAPCTSLPQTVKVSQGSVKSRPNNVGHYYVNQFANEGGVPRLYQTSLPENISSLTVAERKKRFVGIVLPLILTANERIATDRKALLSLRRKPSLNAREMLTLKDMAKRYRLGNDENSPLTAADKYELFLRVDEIPPSLALAQGAIESGWGTSRFAQLGNALYGEWVWGDSAKGIVPEGRGAGKTHRIRAFEALQGSVTSYIRNLNTHPAYKELREHRANLRANGERVTGTRLVYALLSYSTRREAYVDDLKSIIRRNGFEMLDDLDLLAINETQTTP